ncbi:MAG TPA: 50S ribosomal protein L10 [Candidatus Hydrogenedentes bacterium]|nr:50S ribosomal protein L10 [Candidatus Hydrogenedentota bacterium]HQE82335.1 50S ribosomal protein L10 [Candidatus Hydrogenedentota bacterium]HQM50798.1 50S ribosomal protein L10 [Candidatus Hydrogenedentota bacterium]
MAKLEKVEAVAEIKQRIEGSQIVILTKYIGMNASQATNLRAKLRNAKVGFKVFKNTLAKRALDELNLSDAARYLEGPIAWAFSDDPVAPAKLLADFEKEVPAVKMNGGILEGKVVSLEQLKALAELPPREVVLAQVVGTIAAPLRNFVGVLNAVPRNLVNVLDQIRKQKEETAETAA